MSDKEDIKNYLVAEGFSTSEHSSGRHYSRKNDDGTLTQVFFAATCVAVWKTKGTDLIGHVQKKPFEEYKAELNI